MKAPTTTTAPSSTRSSTASAPVRPALKGPAFRAILQHAAGTPGRSTPATETPEALARPARERRRRDEEPAGSEPEPARAAPRPPPLDALREPGAASFAPATIDSGRAAAAPALDPVALAAAAERVLRSLRVGTDAQGRSLVQLEVASGSLAGCRVELRRVAGGVAVDVRAEGGGADPREAEILEALRQRGIEVV